LILLEAALAYGADSGSELRINLDGTCSLLDTPILQWTEPSLCLRRPASSYQGFRHVLAMELELLSVMYWVCADSVAGGANRGSLKLFKKTEIKHPPVQSMVNRQGQHHL